MIPKKQKIIERAMLCIANPPPTEDAVHLMANTELHSVLLVGMESVISLAPALARKLAIELVEMATLAEGQETEKPAAGRHSPWPVYIPMNTRRM